MADPTIYPELNAVLAQLLERTRPILAENFCGAYLQGSFALGEADVHSDVDFLVVTHEEIDEKQLAALQRMHNRIYGLDVAWAQHLEGSYISEALLRRVDPARTRLPFLDNGACELVWDEHCNTAVVRWLLREHGVVLDGPDPRQLVDPVSAEQLRSEALELLPEYAAWARSCGEAGTMSRWQQPYLVLTLCRILHSIDNGTVVSKRTAGEWARDALAVEWGELIRRALADRPDPWLRVHQSADPEDVDRTLAFIESVVDEGNL